MLKGLGLVTSPGKARPWGLRPWPRDLWPGKARPWGLRPWSWPRDLWPGKVRPWGLRPWPRDLWRVKARPWGLTPWSWPCDTTYGLEKRGFEGLGLGLGLVTYGLERRGLEGRGLGLDWITDEDSLTISQWLSQSTRLTTSHCAGFLLTAALHISAASQKWWRWRCCWCC